ncbi:MAG: dihydrolipoyl dehydrogenase [Candidatus Latescibacterota bacterium]|nr:dihydrolipoyl dehydrogenase [Candidatus Latescibacterota bacterium]
MPEYDLIVIGAGPGGYVAAARAADLGMKVACVDKGWLGGTCLQVGCIPSKALLEATHHWAELQDGLDDQGIIVGELKLDLAAMMARKSKIVDTMTKGVGALFKGKGVDYVVGSARLAGGGSVVVDGADDLNGERILLATGSAPVELPDLPFDGTHILSSTEALSLESVPATMVVIGAGAIGLEMGSVWSRLGTQVEIIEFMNAVLPGADAEISQQVQRTLKRQGMSFRLSTRATGADLDGDGIKLHLAGQEGENTTVECDCVLVAVGRRPQTEGLGLESAGVETTERGFVTVDDDYRTTVDGVFAIGDVTPGPMLAHKAEAEGLVAVERMAGMGSSVNYEAIPNVVYTHPEVASVGLSETAAQEAGHQVRTGKYLFRANARAHSINCIDGFVKVVADAGTDRLLGVHIFGPQASHLIAEAVVAMEFRASAEDLARTVHAHPSLSEVVREAAASLSH